MKKWRKRIGPLFLAGLAIFVAIVSVDSCENQNEPAKLSGIERVPIPESAVRFSSGDLCGLSELDLQGDCEDFYLPEGWTVDDLNGWYDKKMPDGESFGDFFWCASGEQEITEPGFLGDWKQKAHYRGWTKTNESLGLSIMEPVIKVASVFEKEEERWAGAWLVVFSATGSDYGPNAKQCRKKEEFFQQEWE